MLFSKVGQNELFHQWKVINQSKNNIRIEIHLNCDKMVNYLLKLCGRSTYYFVLFTSFTN